MAKIARNRAKPLAELVEECIAPSLASQGFATSDVILAWPDIVGSDLAAVTQPLKLEWPRRRISYDPDERPLPASLVVRVESAFALELQHLSPLVMEKVNTYFGWRCVGKLVLKQGPVHKEAEKKVPPPPLTDREKSRISEAVLSLEDDNLRHALRSFGQSVLSANKKPEP